MHITHKGVNSIHCVVLSCPGNSRELPEQMRVRGCPRLFPLFINLTICSVTMAARPPQGLLYVSDPEPPDFVVVAQLRMSSPDAIVQYTAIRPPPPGPAHLLLPEDRK